MKKLIYLSLTLLFFLLLLTGCNSTPTLVGKWEYWSSTGNSNYFLLFVGRECEFKSNGELIGEDGFTGKWSMLGGESLKMDYLWGDNESTETFTYVLKDDMLTISQPDNTLPNIIYSCVYKKSE